MGGGRGGGGGHEGVTRTAIGSIREQSHTNHVASNTIFVEIDFCLLVCLFVCLSACLLACLLLSFFLFLSFDFFLQCRV